MIEIVINLLRVSYITLRIPRIVLTIQTSNGMHGNTLQHIVHKTDSHKYGKYSDNGAERQMLMYNIQNSI